MSPQDYLESVKKTEVKEYLIPHINNISPRLQHAVYGIAGESGEVIDIVKKTIFYGKPLDSLKLIEEIGDLFWYIAIACDALEVSFERVWEHNINKLSKRYKKGFTELEAINRVDVHTPNTLDLFKQEDELIKHNL